jgi:hypothetical protein
MMESYHLAKDHFYSRGPKMWVNRTDKAYSERSRAMHVRFSMCVLCGGPAALPPIITHNLAVVVGGRAHRDSCVVMRLMCVSSYSTGAIFLPITRISRQLDLNDRKPMWKNA